MSLNRATAGPPTAGRNLRSPTNSAAAGRAHEVDSARIRRLARRSTHESPAPSPARWWIVGLPATGLLSDPKQRSGARVRSRAQVRSRAARVSRAIRASTTGSHPRAGTRGRLRSHADTSCIQNARSIRYDEPSAVGLPGTESSDDRSLPSDDGRRAWPRRPANRQSSFASIFHRLSTGQSDLSTGRSAVIHRGGRYRYICCRYAIWTTTSCGFGIDAVVDATYRRRIARTNALTRSEATSASSCGSRSGPWLGRH